MDKKELSRITKKHFTKFGLLPKSLGEITNLIEGSTDENSTEEEVIELCKTYEPLAKSLQTDIETRVTTAVEKAKKGPEGAGSGDGATDEPNPGNQPPASSNEAVLAAIAALSTEVTNMKKGQSVLTNNETVVAALKELKMSEKQIESTMLGRSFETAESATEFIEKQTELYTEISKEQVHERAGSGFAPMGSGGNVTKTQKEADITAFNAKF